MNRRGRRINDRLLKKLIEQEMKKAKKQEIKKEVS
jgi:hypothetical protein